VGMTEAGRETPDTTSKCIKHSFAGNGRAMIVGDTEGLVKSLRRAAARYWACIWSGPWARVSCSTKDIWRSTGTPCRLTSARSSTLIQPLRGNQRDDDYILRPIVARLIQLWRRLKCPTRHGL
jgi:hypothetical protein